MAAGPPAGFSTEMTGTGGVARPLIATRAASVPPRETSLAPSFTVNVASAGAFAAGSACAYGTPPASAHGTEAGARRLPA